MNEALRDADALIARIRAYNPASDTRLIRDAWTYAHNMHDGQLRRSGEPYFSHPVAVAMLLADQRLDDATIATALLHDTVEDTKSTTAEIAARFGPRIAVLVDGVTKITNLQLSTIESRQAENFRKLLLAMSRDLRVILVKLADRLHNMRTIRHLPPDKQMQKALETMDIYAPLAGRMGMQEMREELEDLAFRVLNPEARKSIMRRFLILQRDSGDIVTRITDDIREVLARRGIAAEVFGRAKKPYSIWRKMQEKELTFSRLSDIYGFRVITADEDDCYRVLGAIHRRWKAVPGRFKDYISQPKSNGYRSIHTTVSGRDGKRVEVQIRTRQMHEVAETGVAAHWSYRDGHKVENPFAVDPARWLESLSESFSRAEDHHEFLEHMKLEMFADQVFCFTPKGDVIKLPKGATPIDFAYAIHTRIGESCVGAKVDGRRVPLWTRLRNGQSVEITTAEGQRPQAAWMDIAATGKARAAIRRALREEHRDRFVKLGRELARVALEHVGKKASDKALATAARNLGIKNASDLLAQLGSAELSGQTLVETLYPELLDKPQRAAVPAARAVVGLSGDQTSQRAACCQPIPGERIVGITTRGRGVLIHAIDCPALVDVEDQPDRWVDLHWQPGRHEAAYAVTLIVVLLNDAGVLGRICTLIGEQNANISDIHFTDRKPDFYRMQIDVEVRDTEHLYSVMTAVEADSDVAGIERLKSGPRGA
jgi:GTP diphosphokinase / guanosine-3',5'-bis(diphosphate) 3'-diphosphatase